MKIIQIEIAGRTYDVSPLPIKANREWRKQFDAPLRTAVDFAAEIGTFTANEFEDSKTMIATIGKALSGRLSEVANILLGSADMIVEAVFQYSPAIAKDRKHIEENGFDEELVAAFMKLLALAFPFGRAIQGLMKLGQGEQLTEANSATESLESETTN